MKSLASPKKLLATLLSLVMVCTMLQCVLFTASASEETIDTLIAAVNADSTVTLDEADEINKISVLYDALADKTTYTTQVSALKTSLYDLLTEGVTSKTTSLSDFNKDHWPSYAYATNAENSVRIKYNSGNDPQIVCGPNTGTTTNVNYAPDNALDGLEVMINNYYQFDSSAARAGFAVQFTPWTYQPASQNYIQMTTSDNRAGMILHFDLKESQIIINSRLTAGGEIKVGTLALDDSEKARLTYANFAHKAISVGMRATGNAENPYQVTLMVSGDATPITALIPADYYADTMTNSGKVLIGFPAGYWTTPDKGRPSGNACTQFDVLGYRNSKTAQAAIDSVNSGIAALDVNNVKESDAKVIYELLDSYDVLPTTWDKEHTEYEKLLALKSSLIDAAKVGLTTFNGTSDFTTDHWSTSTPPFLTYVDGVARFTLNGDGLSVSKRIGIKSAQKFDGFEVKFSRLRTTSSSATAAGVGLQFGTSAGADLGGATASGFFIYLDAKNGKLYVTSKNSGAVSSKVIATDNALLLENIKDRVFTIGINATGNADNPYKLTVKVAGGGTVVANIPSAYVTPSLFMNSVANGTTYVTYTRGGYGENGAALSGNLYQTVDMIGYTNTANIKAAEALIAKIPATVTTNDGNVIFEAEEAYAALTDYEKTCVDGAKITAARTEYDALFTAETAALEYTVVADACLTSGMKITNINSWWGAGFATELEGNGIRVNWKNGGKGNRLAIGTAVNMDGLSIRFNNFKRTSGEKAELAILLSRNSSNYHEGKDVPFFAVILDAATGTLKVSTKWVNNDTQKQIVYDIIASDLLKYENLAGAKFTVDFKAIGEFEYKATVTVADKSVSGIIPAKALAEVSDGDATTSLYNPNNCNFAIAAWSGNYQSVDVVGFKTDATVQVTKIEGVSLTIADDISANYKVSQGILSANQYVNPEIDFTLAGETITVEGEKEGTGYYNFTFPSIAPDLMGETITATLYAKRAGSEERVPMGDVVEYSIKQYCYSMLEKYPNDEELCDLIVDLLRYGAASQGYTNKTENGLVTDALTDAQKAFGTAYTAATAGKVALTADATYDAANKQVTWKSASLFLADVVNIRFKFTLADGANVNDLTVKATVGGNEVEVSADRIEQINDSSSYYLYFDGATAARMRDAVAITFYNGDTAVSKTVNYSIENYIGTQVDKNEDESLVSMLKALLCYGDSAAAYASK